MPNKTKITPAVLKSFSTKIKHRFVLIDKGNQSIKAAFNSKLNSINTKANQIIQELNLLIEDRQIPYITLEPMYGNLLNNEGKERSKRIRIFLFNDSTSFIYESKTREEMESRREISHILDLWILLGCNRVTVSSIHCDAEILVEEKHIEDAIVDILLDIVMFNSYSFLKEMPTNQKQSFSSQKFNFYKNHNLQSAYDCSDDKILYYSLAFSARNSKFELDISKYICIWERFMAEYYKGQTHVEKSVLEQLKQHVDFDQLPKNLPHRFESLPEGAYLLLRTNTDRTRSLHPRILSIFKARKFRIGLVKIVPLSNFYEYLPLLKNLDVSAFKVINIKQKE